MAARILDGQRSLTKVVYDGIGFLYHLNKVTPTKTYMRCVVIGCKGWCVTDTPVVDGASLIVNKAHNHGPDPLQVEVLDLKRRIYQRVETEPISLLRVFNEECSRVPLEVSRRIGFQELLPAMKKRRRSVQPNIPNSLQEFGEMLAADSGRFSSTVLGGQFFRKLILGNEEEGTSVVFASPLILERVRETRELHIDGTFKVVPRNPMCQQLMTIMTVHYDHAFPAIMVLMERKTMASYVKVFEYCRELMESFEASIIITDFEIALQSAAREVFGGSRILGCWFHFANALCKKARKLGLYGRRGNLDIIKKIIKMAMALPLLPAQRITEGFNHITNIANQEGVWIIVARFCNYVERTWIRGVGVLNLTVSGESSRTNNFQEAYHSVLKRHLGLHPPIWEFTEGLRKQEGFATRQLASVVAGRRISQKRKKAYLIQDRRIKEANLKLEAGLFSVGEFLSSCSLSIHAFEDRMRVEAEDEEDDPSDEDLDEPEDLFIDVTARGPEEFDGNNVNEAAPPPVQETLPIVEQGPTSPLEEGQAVDQVELVVQGDEMEVVEQYRTRAIMFSSSHFMSEADVIRQREELMQSLQGLEEPFFEAEEGAPVCVYCNINKPTRTASPCGHSVVCRECLPRVVMEPLYYSVTRGDGSIVATPIRLPVTCPICRALVGQFIHVYT